MESVNPLHLLLLEKLDGVVGLFAPPGVRGTVLTRWVGTTFDAALLRVALLSLQKELLPLAAAESANCSGVSCHTVLC